MQIEYKNKECIREFWNSRAGLGKWAGTQDIIAKEIEVEALAKYVKEGMSVLEAGCGNGVTAIELARRFSIEITGTDFAEDMVHQAQKMLNASSLKGKVKFSVLDILNLDYMENQYDLIYTERVIINLMEWEIQKKAICNIFKLLKPGGAYLMCENSQNGLDEINRLREAVGLDKYSSPWHNRYLREEEIVNMREDNIVLESIDCYSSTYYFLSRVVNAALAHSQGRQPDYEAPINHLSKKLPSIGECSQGKIWVWRKTLI